MALIVVFVRSTGTPLGALDIRSDPLLGYEGRHQVIYPPHIAACPHDRAVGPNDCRRDAGVAKPVGEFAVRGRDMDNGAALVE